jgi:hypothetical protein
LRGRLPWLGGHEAGHASLGDVDAELQQFGREFRARPIPRWPRPSGR